MQVFIADGGFQSSVLLQVELEVQSATTCKTIHGTDYNADNMICAGPLSGGQDTCKV